MGAEVNYFHHGKQKLSLLVILYITQLIGVSADGAS